MINTRFKGVRNVTPCRAPTVVTFSTPVNPLIHRVLHRVIHRQVGRALLLRRVLAPVKPHLVVVRLLPAAAPVTVIGDHQAQGFPQGNGLQQAPLGHPQPVAQVPLGRPAAQRMLVCHVRQGHEYRDIAGFRLLDAAVGELEVPPLPARPDQRVAAHQTSAHSSSAPVNRIPDVIGCIAGPSFAPRRSESTPPTPGIASAEICRRGPRAWEGHVFTRWIPRRQTSELTE